nr:putative membrane protein [Quercus suber]
MTASNNTIQITRHLRQLSDNHVDDVDSVATTLLASASTSKENSLDKARTGHDRGPSTEYTRTKFQESRNGTTHEGDGDEEDDHDRHQDGNMDESAEDEYLLGHRTSSTRAAPVAAETAHGVAGDEATAPSALHEAPVESSKPVTWSSLPRKGQLAILTCARLSEPLTQTSLSAYMFYQLKSFTLADGSSPSDATVASQVGVLAAAFTGAQFCTAILWGRLADHERIGRKRVILIGLLGTAVGSLGFGFSRNFGLAVFWRCLGGMLNGNVGVMRTMISEIISEKKYQSRAFLLLPMTFNIGVIIGPLLGGLLADPVHSYPSIFGPESVFGGVQGVWWMTHWPYALPNVVSAIFLAISALALTLGLEETLEIRRGKTDWGIHVGKWLGKTFLRRNPRHQYQALEQEMAEGDVEMLPRKQTRKKESKVKRKLPLRRIWTSNLLLTLLSHGLLAGHVGTFNALWFVFLSSARYDPQAQHHNNTTSAADTSPTNSTTAAPLPLPEDYTPHLPFRFTGGLALPPPSIGTALAILGVIGISLQLLLYPRLSFRLGIVPSYRLALLLFPISYLFAPYLSVTPSSTAAPSPASGPAVWTAITAILLVQVAARTFALPATAILVNNASPHPSVLGTVHGIAQSVSSGTRTVGPVLVNWAYGKGLESGVVGLAWWCMAGVAVLGAVAGRFVREGDGHEIWLEGEAEEHEALKQEQEQEQERTRGPGKAG